MGSGKTTLTNMLAKHYGWTPRFEAVDFNPYLEDYYKDIKRWTFNLEVYFLKQRFKDLLDIAKSEETIIQDTVPTYRMNLAGEYKQILGEE